MTTIFLQSFGLGGYRSFGELQKFERLAKINLLIGPNNCGKSNVLRFLHEIYPRLSERDAINLPQIERHTPDYVPFNSALSVSLEIKDKARKKFIEYIRTKFPQEHMELDGYVLRAFLKKSELDKSNDNVWFVFDEQKKLVPSNWEDIFSHLTDREITRLWSVLTNRQGGDRKSHWYPEALQRLIPNWPAFDVEMIPAIRRVGVAGSQSDGFSGEGIIERLNKLQHPHIERQQDKKRFASINQFLKSVTGNESAEMEIPHAKDTIHVLMDGRTLPLESLGTGIHEVVILATAATLIENKVVCMEEPELHLNPILQKKLVRYLSEKTSNQYFITTHSAALMDTPGAEMYRMQLINGRSVVERVTSDRHRSMVCEDLGYHPSDLLQPNCVIWVEGPSDRIYINYWIEHLAPELVEGIHYSIMFYGGRLASHLSGNDIDEAIEEFISLRRLNRRGCIVVDSDKESEEDDLNKTKQRLIAEFDVGPGIAWVTAGREIENYIPSDQIRAAIAKTVPTATAGKTMGVFDKILLVTGVATKQAPKVEVAKYIVNTYQPDVNVLDLKDRLDKLIGFIKASNPHNVG
ncbi:MAG: ATP-binding protein [Steroidobacter sp.]